MVVVQTIQQTILYVFGSYFITFFLIRIETEAEQYGQLFITVYLIGNLR